MQSALINIAYLISAILFIFGLMNLSHPRTAVRGNRLGATGMLIAIIATLLNKGIIEAGANGYLILFAGLAVGGAIGATLAIRIQMTSMPEMVALLNGFGGGASVLVAGAALTDAVSPGVSLASITGGAGPTLQLTVATTISALIGAVTFFGSVVAFGKLQGAFSDRFGVFSGQQIINALLAITVVVLAVMIVLNPANTLLFWILVAVASLLGFFLVTPIGGADMPVAIALLNSYSGLAAASTGFVLSNNGLIITGSLVGASGLILTRIMCKAMNRSLANVLFGGMATAAVEGPSADSVYAGKVKSTTGDEVAMLFDTARRVVIVPGYGMAVSQAQHAVRDLTNLLEDRGITVEFGIHPVAGRMPGHMNVLLAEANIAYDKMIELENINPTFKETDIVMVIGANDVVNPVARTDPKSVIAGMPILDVDQAKMVIVIKRSLSPGYAGIPNPLFAMDNTLMFFGDGKKAVLDLITALKES